MKKTPLIDRIDIDRVNNPHLKGLIVHLRESMAAGVSGLSIAPETAQRSQWKHHRDHFDYQAHRDDPPKHSDYCD